MGSKQGVIGVRAAWGCVAGVVCLLCCRVTQWVSKRHLRLCVVTPIKRCLPSVLQTSRQAKACTTKPSLTASGVCVAGCVPRWVPTVHQNRPSALSLQLCLHHRGCDKAAQHQLPHHLPPCCFLLCRPQGAQLQRQQLGRECDHLRPSAQQLPGLSPGLCHQHQRQRLPCELLALC